MFNLFKKKPISTSSHSRPEWAPGSRVGRGESIQVNSTVTQILHLSGLHCTSCAVNIDLALEDLPGVKATTNYAKSETKIEYNPDQTTLDQIHFAIRDLGYSIL